MINMNDNVNKHMKAGNAEREIPSRLLFGGFAWQIEIRCPEIKSYYNKSSSSKS